MNIFSNHKKILTTVILLIVVFFAYWYFVLSKQDSNTQNNSGALVRNTENPQVASTQKTYDREFVAGLLSLNSINLDTGLFDSAAYKALSFPEQPFIVDYNIPYGRQNPFLPIGVGVSSGVITQEPVQEPAAPSTVKTSSDIVPVATTTPTPKPLLPNTKR